MLASLLALSLVIVGSSDVARRPDAQGPHHPTLDAPAHGAPIRSAAPAEVDPQEQEEDEDARALPFGAPPVLAPPEVVVTSRAPVFVAAPSRLARVSPGASRGPPA